MGAGHIRRAREIREVSMLGRKRSIHPWQSKLVLHWDERAHPIPARTLGACNHGHGFLGQAAPPWLATGDFARPFDFCGHIRRLLEDIAARCDELRHIEVPRILVAMTLSRNGRKHGLQARVTPLRFHGGQLTRQRQGITYQVQRLFMGEHEYLYLMTFCLPRFLDQEFDGKFVTLFHELYHISPKFDGDLRRHDGRTHLHSRSQRRYDRHMAELARAYLAGNPPADLHAFLRLNFAQLSQRHGGVRGFVVPRPKVFPVSWPGGPGLAQASLTSAAE
jgi:Putative phage metallopeptidase